MASKSKRRNGQNKTKVTVSKLTFHKLGWLEWVTIGLSLWFLFYPHPYTLLFSVLLGIPVLGLILNGLHGKPSIASLVEITADTDGTDNYDVANFIDVAAWVILLRVLIDYEFESLYSLIIPGAITFVLMLVLLFTTHSLVQQTKKSKTWIYLSLIFNLFIYSYAATYGINCAFDNSEPTVYEARVLDKTISEGKHTYYYLKVTPWGHHLDPENISVAESQWDNTPIGSSIKIDVKQGLFHIPWYYVE